MLVVVFVAYVRKGATRMTAAYDRLAARFARIATIGEAAAMLGWDAAAMMPPGGGGGARRPAGGAGRPRRTGC